MLVLSRRIGESIMLRDDIEIVLLSIDGGRARIGIEAPKEVSVYREEVYKKIVESQEQIPA